MLERLHEHGFDDLDPAHLIVLQYPGPQGMRPSDLAVQLRISKQALNYLLGQLEGGGYLERRPDPDDLRSKRIVLTKRGTKVAHVIRDAVTEMESTWSEQLGPKQFARLRGLLLELNRSCSCIAWTASGRNRARTCDLPRVKRTLSQLSYAPWAVSHRISRRPPPGGGTSIRSCTASGRTRRGRTSRRPRRRPSPQGRSPRLCRGGEEVDE